MFSRLFAIGGAVLLAAALFYFFDFPQTFSLPSSAVVHSDEASQGAATALGIREGMKSFMTSTAPWSTVEITTPGYPMPLVCHDVRSSENPGRNIGAYIPCEKAGVGIYHRNNYTSSPIMVFSAEKTDKTGTTAVMRYSLASGISSFAPSFSTGSYIRVATTTNIRLQWSCQPTVTTTYEVCSKRVFGSCVNHVQVITTRKFANSVTGTNFSTSNKSYGEVIVKPVVTTTYTLKCPVTATHYETPTEAMYDPPGKHSFCPKGTASVGSVYKYGTVSYTKCCPTDLKLSGGQCTGPRTVENNLPIKVYLGLSSPIVTVNGGKGIGKPVSVPLGTPVVITATYNKVDEFDALSGTELYQNGVPASCANTKEATKQVQVGTGPRVCTGSGLFKRCHSPPIYETRPDLQCANKVYATRTFTLPTSTPPGTYVFSGFVRSQNTPEGVTDPRTVTVTVQCPNGGTSCIPCPLGQHDEGGVCVPNTIIPPPVATDMCTNAEFPGEQTSVPQNATASGGICTCQSGYAPNSTGGCVAVSLNLTPSRTYVRPEEPVTFTWSASGVTSCTLRGNGSSNAGINVGPIAAQSGTVSERQTTSAGITARTTFTLSCQIVGGASQSLSRTIVLVPAYEED